jgi:hypothetical protein
MFKPRVCRSPFPGLLGERERSMRLFMEQVAPQLRHLDPVNESETFEQFLAERAVAFEVPFPALRFGPRREFFHID